MYVNHEFPKQEEKINCKPRGVALFSSSQALSVGERACRSRVVPTSVPVWGLRAEPFLGTFPARQLSHLDTLPSSPGPYSFPIYFKCIIIKIEPVHYMYIIKLNRFNIIDC